MTSSNGTAGSTHPCPKCGRQLQPSGEVTVSADPGSEGPTLPVYQCDECLVEKEFMGETMEMALTFCVNDQGKAIDPAEPDNELRF